MSVQPCVLIVDDDEDLCSLLRYNLEGIGFEVIYVHDGEAALQEIATLLPNIVVLDWMLPTMSGLEVCRTIRNTPRTHDIPIIMVTAKDREADMVQGFKSGVDDYVTKPFSIFELSIRIGAVIRRTNRLVPPGGSRGAC